VSVSPWVVETSTGKKILIRNCSGFEELDACVDLQIAVWGYSNDDVIPRRVFIVAQRVAGQVIGAFDLNRGGGEAETGRENMIGFAMALPAIHASGKDGAPEAYMHSHMLAVDPRYRNDGIGRRLKLFQRQEALDRKIGLMEWTFDPLEIKNSFLNIHRLGTIVRSYTPNFYGVSSSRLQAGLPTDRLHAEWYLGSRRVRAILDGAPCTSPAIRETIEVPASIGEWKSSEDDFPKAVAVQSEIRQRLQQAFQSGLAITGFRRDSAGNGNFELSAFEELERDLL